MDLGYCLPPEEYEKIEANPPQTIDEFTDAVVKAEGFNPQLIDKEFRSPVREMVAKFFLLSMERSSHMKVNLSGDGSSNTH